MKSYYVATLAAYIAGLTGYSLAGLDQVMDCTAAPLDWHLPAYQFGMIAIPALLGWLIGHNKGKQHD